MNNINKAIEEVKKIREEDEEYYLKHGKTFLEKIQENQVKDELREEIASEAGCYDPPYWDKYEVADRILSLVNAERCVWTKDDWQIHGQDVYITSCGMFEFYEGYTFCHKCGKRIEVKDEG